MKFPTNITVHVTQQDIDDAECGNPNKCAIKLAVKRSLDMSHGYIHVDAGGVSITRRPDYREKADLPRRMRNWIVAFDRHLEYGRPAPSPTSFPLHFRKTSPIIKRDTEQVNAARRKRVAEGRPDRRYPVRRSAGIATTTPGPDTDYRVK